MLPAATAFRQPSLNLLRRRLGTLVVAAGDYPGCPYTPSLPGLIAGAVPVTALDNRKRCPSTRRKTRPHRIRTIQIQYSFGYAQLPHPQFRVSRQPSGRCGNQEAIARIGAAGGGGRCRKPSGDSEHLHGHKQGGCRNPTTGPPHSPHESPLSDSGDRLLRAAFARGNRCNGWRRMGGWKLPQARHRGPAESESAAGVGSQKLERSQGTEVEGQDQMVKQTLSKFGNSGPPQPLPSRPKTILRLLPRSPALRLSRQSWWGRSATNSILLPYFRTTARGRRSRFRMGAMRAARSA